MLSCECFYWNRVHTDDWEQSEPRPFSLPSPLPKWPQGRGFAAGRISLGELEVVQVTQFEKIWTLDSSRGKAKAVTFFKPVGIPQGFHCLGHYCQPNDRPLRGYVLAARFLDDAKINLYPLSARPALVKPVGYSLVWDEDSFRHGSGYFWLPIPPAGYKSVGIIVTKEAAEPDLDEVRCVRDDLTESCETCGLLSGVDSNSSRPFRVWNVVPEKRGVSGCGVSVGTFFCSTGDVRSNDSLTVGCLKNLAETLCAMPSMAQAHALIENYGPRFYFHPDEIYMPSSVQWFFKNGALLYKYGNSMGERIVSGGSNLPPGGENDGEFWLDLPEDDEARERLKKGDLDSAELYAHVKPAMGGTFTDIAMWVFCPFNGPATLKIGLMTMAMNRLGEHVSDWEHVTLRISNFTGELWQVFFSQHSGGEWVDASELEFADGNRPVVYSSKHGHASYPRPGMYLMGSSKLGIGVRNDTAKSKFLLDSNQRYQIVATEYLTDDGVAEPCWLQYMREWGPTVVYDSTSEINKIIDLLPFFIRYSVENLLELFPIALYGEEGPTGPKEKDNWKGDETV